MFDKIQSTYFKRVTTGVLALFMTASSGFSYAVPVYAQEVTTAAAKRKKEEEFSSTESSTLTLRENDKKNEAEGSKTTETDGIKVTTNGSSDVQPEVKIEKPDNKKEPGRKLSSKKAQEDLKEMIQNKKYSYQDILQRIFEIDDFTFYSKLTLDEIKFLMSGTTEEKYEIAELLMYKSVYLYADYDITTEDFYSYLFQYFQFLDECNVDLKDEEIEKIEKQLLLDINIYYVGDKDMYQKDLNEYLENTTSPLILKNSWHIAFGDPLCKAFNDCCFTNPWITDQTWIILCPSAKDLHQTFHLTFTSDHRIKLPKHCFLCQICTILKQHIFSCSIFHITAIRDCFIIFILRTSEINSCSN